VTTVLLSDEFYGEHAIFCPFVIVVVVFWVHAGTLSCGRISIGALIRRDVEGREIVGREATVGGSILVWTHQCGVLTIGITSAGVGGGIGRRHGIG